MKIEPTWHVRPLGKRPSKKWVVFYGCRRVMQVTSKTRAMKYIEKKQRGMNGIPERQA